MQSKMKSRKLWVTLWAMAMVMYIVITEKVDFLQIAVILSAVPITYMGANALTKKGGQNENTSIGKES